MEHFRLLYKLGYILSDCLVIRKSDINNNINNNLDYTRTDFNTYANIVVLGKNCHVTNYTSRIVEVQPFSSEYEFLHQVLIVNAVIQYDDLCVGEIYLLVLKNALYIPDMTHNIMLPFLLKEVGLIMDNILKSQVSMPTKNHYSIYFSNKNIRILLLLNKIFSYFLSKKPSLDILN